MNTRPVSAQQPVRVLVVAVPETSGSALYGMVDVLKAAGNIWQTLVRSPDATRLFDVNIVSPLEGIFHCGNDIPVEPAVTLGQPPNGDILVLPELWLGPDEDIAGRYPELMDWIRDAYRAGMWVYSACSGAVMLAETGLLNGCPATSHWGYQDLFRIRYPEVRFQPEPNLVFADPAGRIVTAGGTTSWHDLALHIIARHASTGEALRIAKVYLLKWHGEGQRPFTVLTRDTPHADSVVRRCQKVMAEHFRDSSVLQMVVTQAGIPERTLKRRFRTATGTSLIEYVQGLRIEEAKRLLEGGQLSVDDISADVGYEDHSFFRRLFKRLTGLTPSQYRRMFQPVVNAGGER